MLNPHYSLLLLDLDGTVADTDRMLVESMHILYDKYRHGVYTPIEQIYYFSGPPIKETIEKEFPNCDTNAILEDFVKISWDLYPKTVTPYPHVIETLERIKNKGVKIAIVTSKAHASTEHCLKVIHLENIVDYFISIDDVKNPKPHAESIIKCMEHFHILDKKQVLYVGDNTSDYLTAKNANVDVALVKWGPRKIDTNNKPNYWLNNFLELEDIIDGTNL